VKSTKVILVVLFLACMLVPVREVGADIAPEPEVELGGLQPSPFKPTEVAMLYERVEMELGMFQDDTERQEVQNRVMVNAYFVMQNQGEVDETMQAVFPSQSAPVCRGNYHGDSFTAYYILEDSFDVSINGTTVPTSTLNAPYADCEDYPWMAFDVTFPANQEVLIKVSYIMETWNVDLAQNIDYILETGAGWKGNIGRGYIILKFPYTVSSENVLSAASEGYQTLYNEIFWSFQDLEPTPENNIHISIVSPNVWLDIQRLRNQVADEPRSPDAWLALLEKYNGIAYSDKGMMTRDQHYAHLIPVAYEEAIRTNPDNAELSANYALYKLFGWSPHMEPITPDQAEQVLPWLNRALALEPENETANYVLWQLSNSAPFLTYTPPATIPPTATSQFTSTPSITPTATKTLIPSAKPTFTEARTGSNKELPLTATPRPTSTKIVATMTNTTTMTSTNGEEKETGNQSPLTIAIIGMAATFIAGLVVGTLWSSWRKR
jgi:hypothetical protein